MTLYVHFSSIYFKIDCDLRIAESRPKHVFLLNKMEFSCA